MDTGLVLARFSQSCAVSKRRDYCARGIVERPTYDRVVPSLSTCGDRTRASSTLGKRSALCPFVVVFSGDVADHVNDNR